MSESHHAYLSLGSNIQPDVNLVRAIELLQAHGRIEKLSNAWESESVGAVGPHYLNACLLLVTPLDQAELKEHVLLPIETQLGRKRTENKFAPRPIDIDIVLFDEESSNEKHWEQAFVIVPLAEIYPEYKLPHSQESMIETAARLRRGFWMEARREVFSQFRGNKFTA